MQWVSSLSRQSNLSGAISECLLEINGRMGEVAAPDLFIVFSSAIHTENLDQVPQLLKFRYPDAQIIGCSGSGIIGGGIEIEGKPAISLLAAHLPAVQASLFYISPDQLPSPDASPDEWLDLVGVEPAQGPNFLLLADPFSTAIDEIVAGLDYAYPKSPKVGGMASGAFQPGGHRVLIQTRVERDGLVGIAFTGNIVMDTVVAQGCRPIGKPMKITSSEKNVLLELDGENPIEALQKIYETLSAEDRMLLQRSLFIGIAMDHLNESLEAGDFLIRNIVGADTEKGLLAVGAMIQEGQIVQFHVRDAQSSAQELRERLLDYKKLVSGPNPEGALLFSCTGRGQNLYGRPNHDSEIFHSLFGAVPVSGFFCSGEIGPVSGTTYLHAYTSSFAFIRPLTRTG